MVPPSLVPAVVKNRPKSASSAFSLIEMLVVIAIIGVIAAIALPAVKNVSESSVKVKNRQNAQNLASLSMAAAQAGVAHVLPDSMGGVEATVRLLREGIYAQSGSFSGEFFCLPGLSDEEITNAAQFLDIVYDTHELRLVFQGDS